jgi:hypothetical protein
MGPDPVHPGTATCRLLPSKISDRIDLILAEPTTPPLPHPNAAGKRKADTWDAWVASSQSVVKHAEP